MQNFSPFRGVSLLAVGDFFQQPLVNQKDVLIKPSKGSYRSFNGWLWVEFQLHELIAHERNDPDFAQYLIGCEKASKQIMM